MDPETLVTFLFRAPPQHRIVELLGSWDNFTQPYQMHHDRRRGAGTWTGCFRFENIIFDGDNTDWGKPRSGGLKQGGVYWYYYRLDYDIEAFDDSQACSAHCPLMPGQMMNVIEVPTEIVEPPSRARSACYDGTAGTPGGPSLTGKQTMEPGDKFAVLEPPPVSKVHGRCISDLALNGRLEHSPPSARESVVSPLPSPVEDAGKREDLDSRPSKRRCSGNRPSSSASRRSKQSLSRSHRFGSDPDAEATDAPLREPHPDPLRSLPVDEATRQSWNGAAAFDLWLAQSSVFRSGDDEQELYGDGDEQKRCNEQELRNDEDVGSVYGPASVCNVQMYGSPLSKACDTDCDWRPGLYSLPSESLLQHRTVKVDEHAIGANAVRETFDLQEKLYADVLNVCPEDGPDVERSYVYSPPDITLELANADNHLAKSVSHTDQDELWSPTFSAATASSNGLNTPLRLSAGYSRDTTAPSQDSEALDDITQRLQSLGGLSAQSSHLRLEEPQRSFTGYALPQPAIGSVQSFGKLSSSPRDGLEGADGFAVPTLVLQPSGSSTVEDIFSELGYLGASIT